MYLSDVGLMICLLIYFLISRLVVTNKLGNTWNELAEALRAKKSELLETISEEAKGDSQWNKWSFRALKSSALGPTMALLRSGNT